MDRAALTRLGIVALIGLVLLTIGCREPAANGTPAAEIPRPTRASALVPLPTLYPTSTSETPPTPTATRPAVAAAPTPTPIDVGQTVVFIRYAIPALGLDRVLEGNVASQITLRDENSGLELGKSNQAAVLLELQSVLDGLLLPAIPDGCRGCVLFEYQLPLAGQAGSGWLQDPQILASVENFFAANLGPHFPPDTTVGLRRSASNTDAAHTVAVSADGTLWRWTALETLVVSGQADAPAAAQILAAAALLATEGLDDARYWLDCPGKPLEWLRLSDAQGAALTVRLRCPELTLPTTLTPLYLALEQAAAPLLSGDTLAANVAPLLPLDQTLYFSSPAGALTLAGPDRARVAGLPSLAGGAPVSGTLPISTTIALSLTLALSGTTGVAAPDLALAQRGLVTDTATLDPYVLILRSAEGVVAATWTNSPPASVRDLVDLLSALLESLLEQLVAVPPDEAATPAPDGTPASTPSPAATPEPTASPTNTPTPPPTAVP